MEKEESVMRKAVLFALCAVLVSAFVAPQVLAADEEGKFKFTGEVRTRFEYIENYFDFSNNSAYNLNDGFSFWPYRVRLGVQGEFADNVKVFGEFQNAGEFGMGAPIIPDTAQFTPPQLLGYPVVTSLLDPAFGFSAGVQHRVSLLYQGYLELGELFVEDLSLRVGRQEHTIGTQLLIGDNEFYNGISFDGARVMWHPERYMVEGFYYKLNETLATSADVNLFGANFDFDISKKLGSAGAYYIRVQNLASVISVGFFTPGIFPPNTGLNTVGARWGRMVKNADDMKENAFDWNAEFAFQNGDYGTGLGKTDFGGSLFEGWFGWNFESAGRSRVHVGTLIASGNKAGDTKYKAFYPLFGNNYAYNRLGDLDLFDITDITDFNAGYCYTSPSESHKAGIMVHVLRLTEDQTILGHTYKNLGTEVDLRYTFNLNPLTSFTAGFATLMPGDVFDHELAARTGGVVTSADTVNRVYTQLRVRW